MITIPRSGWSERSRRVTAIVSVTEMTGDRMLRTTTSGERVADMRKSWSWSRALPTTSRSGMSAKSAARPSPMRKLSEANSTLIGLIASAMAPASRDSHESLPTDRCGGRVAS